MGREYHDFIDCVVLDVLRRDVVFVRTAFIYFWSVSCFWKRSVDFLFATVDVLFELSVFFFLLRY